MKTLRPPLLATTFLAVAIACRLVAADTATTVSNKISVLLITGGHAFEEEPFFKIFADNPDIVFEAVRHPTADGRLADAELGHNYDVIVMYDFNQQLTDKAKADFIKQLRFGTGLVVLHHAIAAYPDWPEYWKIIGAHYYLQKTTVDGVEKARSAWKEGMHYKIHIADPTHPVTRGLKDYEVHDETYKWFDVATDCHPLLTTDEPESNPVIAWAKTYGNARVVYLQSGHDHFAYENPNFRQVVRQAIRWTSKRD